MTQNTAEENQQAEQQGESLANAGITPGRDVRRGLFSSREDEAPPPPWLITFADITALMLTFFVMLYSMSSPEEDKWQEMTTAFNDGFGQYRAPEFQAADQDTIEIEKLDMTKALDLAYLESIVARLTSENENLKDTILVLQPDRLIISLPGDLLFAPGRADVTADGKRALFSIGGVLSRIRNRLEVIGHTDPRPVQEREGAYSSNWELSITRAAHVAAVLEDVGYPRPVTLRGLSSARYDELSPSMDEEQRLNLARRVDIVVLKDDGSRRSFMEMDSGL